MIQHRLPFLIIVLLCLIKSNAQKTYNNYHLIKSDAMVFYNNNNNWDTVYYNETILKDESLIKTQSSFNVFNIESRVTFSCQAAPTATRLGTLIKKGSSRKPINEGTVTFGGTAATHSRQNGGADHSKRINYLFIGDEKSKEKMERLSSDLIDIINANTDYVLGYSEILCKPQGVSNKSIINALKNVPDSVEYGDIIFYLSLNGLKDKNENFHLMTAGAEYDSLTCKYLNTLPFDTLCTYLEDVNNHGMEICIVINTDHPDNLIQYIRSSENCSDTEWASDTDGKSLAESIFDYYINIWQLKRQEKPRCKLYYFIRRE